MASQLVTWSFALVVAIFLPRLLGAGAVGKLYLGHSIWGMVAVLVTFGTDTYLTREVARDSARLGRLFGNVLVIRTGLFLGAALVVAGYVSIANYPSDTVFVIAILAISGFGWQFAGASQSALEGLERMEFTSLGYVVGRAVYSMGAIALLLVGQGVVAVAAMAGVAAAVQVVVQYGAMSRLGVLTLAIDPPAIVGLARSSLPFLLSSAFLAVYQQVDVIIISLLVDEVTIGWYGAASQLLGALLFVPSVFVTALFPALSRLHAGGGVGASRVISKSFDLMLTLGVPMGFGLTVIAEPLVLLLYGPGFSGTGPVLALMGVVLVLTYQNVLVGRYLISAGRQNAWTLAMAVGTILTIPLDLWLVPVCHQAFGNGGIGGALSFIVTELGMVVWGILLLPEGSLSRANAWLAVRTVAAGLAMAAIAWALRGQFIVVPIVVAGLAYGVLALVLRLVDREDLEVASALARTAVSRVRRARPSPGGVD